MKSRKSPDFNDRFKDLPAEIQNKAREAYKTFAHDPTHPSLRFKKLRGTDDVWCVRITNDYRAIGVKEDDTIIWQWIGTHADYDKLV